MNRQMAVAVLACLAGLWPAAAPAQYKINPPPIIQAQPPAPIQIKPVEPIVKPQPPIPPADPPTPAPVVPAPVVKLPPPPLPPPPAGGPAIEPRLPPVALPVNPAGGLIGDRERDALDAARAAAIAERLANQESGLDAAMGSGAPGDDPLTGRYGIHRDAETVMQGFCKTRASRRFPGMCPDRYGNGLPANGDPGGFYTDHTTPHPSSTDPGGALALDGPSAGSGVPSRDGRASDDDQKDVTHETGPDGSIHDSWTDTQGRRHDHWISGDGIDGLHEVHNSNGSFNYSAQTHITPGRNGNWLRETTYTAGRSGTQWHTTERCHHSRCRPASQPGESGYGQAKARPWFCARNPTAKGCQPTAPGSQIDPAHPDGEGTAAGRPRAETPRLGRGAVSDPGSADVILGTPSGGSGSGPLDMKDPARPRP